MSADPSGLLDDPTAGACKRGRVGCLELGHWMPFYQGHVCRNCVKLDQDDVKAGRWPF